MMESAVCCFIMLGALFSLGASQSPDEIRATFGMNGVGGFITFTSVSANVDSTNATFDLRISDVKSYTWQVREFPVITSRPADERCSEQSLGAVLWDLVTVSTVQSITSDVSSAIIQLPLFETQTACLVGHSLLLTSSDGDVVCATIQKVEAPMTKAILRTGIAGSVEIWQHRNDVYSVVTELFDNTGATQENEVELMVSPGSVAADLLTTTEQPNSLQRCDNIVNGRGAEIASFNSPVAVSGLTHKKIIYSADLSNLFETNSEAYVVIEGSDRKHCANFHIVKPKTVKTMFQEQGVMGSISFSQSSPYHPTTVTVELQGLDNTASRYRVHQFPVEYKYADISDTRCADTGESYSPFTPVSFSGEMVATDDVYKVGDLSGKYGLLDSKSNMNEVFIDWNLPLFGEYSIVGRSVVIYNSHSERWVCANIGYPTEVITAQANFNLYAYGSITMIQEADDPTADTSVFISIQNADFSAGSTFEHDYHIHRQRVGNDAMADSGRCSSVGGHYNPFIVDLDAPEYASECLTNELRCEVGDLSNKFGKLDLSSGNAAMGKKSMFTAVNIPLSGAYSVLGRSIVIHDAQSGAGRYSCADIYTKPVVFAKVVNWKGEKNSAGSTATFHESAVISGTTTITLDLRDLGGLVDEYHVHVYAKDDNAESYVCGTTGPHYNPLKLQPPFPAANDSTDRYEVGDLSSKFGGLAGKSHFSATKLDGNLPLRGANSIMGRTFDIHRTSDRRRVMCADIVPNVTAMGGQRIQAKAQFSGKVEGYIMFSQVVTSDGYSDVTINSDLKYKDGSVSEGHNWHVHLNPVESEETGLCQSTKGHYNPFNADVGSFDYSSGAQLCSPSSPRRCEVGDLSSRHSPLVIGPGGKKALNDVFLMLSGKESIMGRSVVIHEAKGGAGRIACATIFPVAAEMHVMYIKTPSSDSESMLDSMATEVAAQVDTDRRNVAVNMNAMADSCYAVTIYFSGTDALTLKYKFNESKMKFYSTQAAKECPETSSFTRATVSVVLLVTMAIAGNYI